MGIFDNLQRTGPMMFGPVQQFVLSQIPGAMEKLNQRVMAMPQQVESAVIGQMPYETQRGIAKTKEAVGGFGRDVAKAAMDNEFVQALMTAGPKDAAGNPIQVMGGSPADNPMFGAETGAGVFDATSAVVGKPARKIESYMMSHRPTKTGANVSNIAKGVGDWEELMPEDVYQHPEWYFPMNQPDEFGRATKESWTVVKKVKGTPDADITIYRASPKKELNEGDWVTLSPTYAQSHAGEDMMVYSYKVKARDVHFAGDDINEFGYYPAKMKTD